jgi:cytochrome b561
MQLKNNQYRFGTITKTFHWLVFLLVCAQFALAWVFDNMFIHKAIGFTLLPLVILWVIWRFFNIQPRPQNAKGWQKPAASITHNLLLLGVFALSVSGIFMSVANGRPVQWFNLYTLEPFMAKNEQLAGYFKLSHEYIAYALIGLVTLHVAGALLHHFYYKDQVLKRMLPFVK